MAGNTEILIKRSLSTGNNTPTTLNQGELAFSYKSNTLFIGTEGSDSYLEIGSWSNLTNLSAGTYGDATHIPIVTVDVHGAVTNVTTSAISTTLALSSDDGSNTMSLLDGTLTVTGGEGITTSIATDTSEIVIDVDNTVVRANTVGAYQTIDGDLNISGNLTVLGTQTSINVANYKVEDSLIYLASNNYTSDIIDIGFVGNYFDGSTQRHAGLFRHAGDKQFYIFDNYDKEPDANTVNPADASFNLGTLHANIVGTLVQSNAFLANEGAPDGSANAGYTFVGDGGYDTGMFSSGDGELEFYSNDQVAFTANNSNFNHNAPITLQHGARLLDTNNGSVIFGFNTQESGNSQRVSIGYQQSQQTGQSWDAVSIGARAGTTNQNDNAIAIGNRAGNLNQSESAVAIGGGSGGNGGAGQNNQGWSAVAIGNHAATDSQGQEAVAVGSYSGGDTQGNYAVALGRYSGNYQQGGNAVAVGHQAGQTSQGTSSVAVGYEAGFTSQGESAVAVGQYAGYGSQGNQAVAVGYNAGGGDSTPQGQNAVAVGAWAGYDHQHSNSIALNASGNQLNPDEAGFYVDPIRANNAIGGNVTTYNTTTREVVYTDVKIDGSGITLANGTVITDADNGFFVDPIREDATSNDILYYNATSKEVTYGTLADLRSDVLSNGAFSWTISGVDGSLTSNVGTTIAASGNSVVIGQNVDLTNSNNNRVTIGNGAGQTGQEYGTTAIGEHAGQTNQGFLSVAVGLNAGNSNQGHSSVAVGHTAGRNNQGVDAVAIGVAAGQSSQGQYAVAIGQRAGYGNNTSQGQYSVAIGSNAGYSDASEFSIILNASSSELNSYTSGLFINPVRYTATQDAVDDGIMFYNQSTKEVRYSYTLDGGSF